MFNGMFNRFKSAAQTADPIAKPAAQIKQERDALEETFKKTVKDCVPTILNDESELRPDVNYIYNETNASYANTQTSMRKVLGKYLSKSLKNYLPRHPSEMLTQYTEYTFQNGSLNVFNSGSIVIYYCENDISPPHPHPKEAVAARAEEKQDAPREVAGGQIAKRESRTVADRCVNKKSVNKKCINKYKYIHF